MFWMLPAFSGGRVWYEVLILVCGTAIKHHDTARKPKAGGGSPEVAKRFHILRKNPNHLWTTVPEKGLQEQRSVKKPTAFVTGPTENTTTSQCTVWSARLERFSGEETGMNKGL